MPRHAGPRKLPKHCLNKYYKIICVKKVETIDISFVVFTLTVLCRFFNSQTIVNEKINIVCTVSIVKTKILAHTNLSNIL